MAGQRAGGVSPAGVFITWPGLAAIGGVVLTLVTVALQLGAVQQTVLVNTGRINHAETREREHVSNDADRFTKMSERMASVEGHHMTLEDRIRRNTERIDRLELNIPVTGASTAILIDRIGRIEARLGVIETAVTTGPNKSDKSDKKP